MAFIRLSRFKASAEVVSSILNWVCPECGGRMGGRGSEFKCHGECQIEWRQLWEQGSKFLQLDARPECLRCNGCKYLVGLSAQEGHRRKCRPISPRLQSAGAEYPVLACTCRTIAIKQEVKRVRRQVFFAFTGGTRATAASVVSRRKVNVSCRYRRTAASL
jgi:hypothetical protein